MKDRTSPRNPAPEVAPIPMPGRLAVNYYDSLLKTQRTGPLAEQAPGSHVTATGTITAVRHLDPRGGRVHATLTDDQGDWALVDFSPETVRAIEPLLRSGARVTVVGLVVAGHGPVPVGIAGHNAEIARIAQSQDAGIAGAVGAGR
jgi:hypothetical protein